MYTCFPLPQAMDAGDYFPVWGTCLGFELLTTIVGGEGILSQVDAENYSIPLNLTSGRYPSLTVSHCYSLSMLFIPPL